MKKRGSIAVGALLAVCMLFAFSAGVLAQSAGTDIVLAKSFTLSSKILKRDVPLLVSVPPGYDAGTAAYPVLYDLNAFFGYTYDIGTVELLNRTGDVPAMIVVGVPQLGYGYTPTPFEERTDTVAGADLSIKFLKEEVIPFVEKNYRTNDFRMLFGHSVSGFFTMYALFNYPDMFSAYLASSPWFQNDDQYWLKNIERFAKERPSGGKSLFMTVGRGEAQLTLDTYRDLEKWMNAQPLPGLAWKSVWLEGDHASMRGRSMYDGLLFFFSGWKLPATAMREADVAAIDASVKASIAKWAGFGFTVSSILPEARLNSLGYNLLGQKEYDKAIGIFKYMVKLYPESFNAHDSLAEAYMMRGNKQKAIKFYKQAIELNPGGTDYEKRVLKGSQDKLRELEAQK